jgi:hypothetical protein
MWNLKFMEHKNHKKSALQGKKWRFFADYATFARERLLFSKAVPAPAGTDNNVA